MPEKIRFIASFLASIEIWLVGMAVVASIIWPVFLPVTVAVAAFFWIIRWLAFGRISLRSPGDWAIVILVVMGLVTLWISQFPDRTQSQLLRLLSGIGLFYSIVNWGISKERYRLLILGIGFSGVSLAILAPITVGWSDHKLSLIPSGIFDNFPLVLPEPIHPNVMAGILVILLPIVFAILVFDWIELSLLARVSVVVACLVMFVILILTKSRRAWLAFSAVGFVLVMLRWRWGWIVSVLALVTAAIIVNSIGVTETLEALMVNNTLGGVTERMETWTRALYILNDFPLTSVGMGSFMETVDRLYPLFLQRPGVVDHAHNLFFQIGIDLALPGLVAWSAGLLLVVVMAWKLYRYGSRTHNPWVEGLGAGLFCSQLALSIHGLTDAVTWGMVRPAPVVWALWGLVISGWYVYVVRISDRLDLGEFQKL